MMIAAICMCGLLQVISKSYERERERVCVCVVALVVGLGRQDLANTFAKPNNKLGIAFVTAVSSQFDFISILNKLANYSTILVC